MLSEHTAESYEADDDEFEEEGQAELDEEVIPFRYSITSYGTDFDVEGLVRRINREDVYRPIFQRLYVWNVTRASRFVESLLLGLPVPGIFLSRDEKGRLRIVDGHQRLFSLTAFYEGRFASGRTFALTGLGEESPYDGLTYESLPPEDKRRLNDSIIHATIIRQDHPDDGDSSIFSVFERINTGGVQLTPQEVRTALYHGRFNELLESLNQQNSWRALFGKVNRRRRDQEYILRFLALYFAADRYHRPLKGFLNDFMGANRDLDKLSAEEISLPFSRTVDAIYTHIGSGESVKSCV